MPAEQHAAIAGLFDRELLGPATAAEAHTKRDDYAAVVERIERGIRQTTGLPTVPSVCVGWVSVPCADEAMAIWLMRALIVENILVRREENRLCLPASPHFMSDERAERLIAAFDRAWRLWELRRRGQN